MIGVEHQPDLRTHRLAHGADEGDVLRNAEADLEFDRAKPFFDVALDLRDDVVERIAGVAPVGACGVGRNAGPQRATHELVNGCLEVLALDVPQRDVDTADRADRQPLLPLVAELIIECLPDPIGGQRVLADQERPERLDDGGVQSSRTEALSPPRRAILADNLDDAPGPRVSAIEGPGEGGVDLCLQDMGVYLRNLHLVCPFWVAWFVYVSYRPATLVAKTQNRIACPGKGKWINQWRRHND